MEKKRFNIVDAIVLLIIIAAVAFVGYKVIGGGAGAGGSATYEVRFLCEEVPEFAAKVIKVGDKVLDEQKETNLGVVKEVTLSDARTYATTAEGGVTVNPKPYYNCVEIVAEVKAENYDFGMIVGSSKYGVGHSITIRVGKAKIFGRVSGIDKIGEISEDVTEALAE